MASTGAHYNLFSYCAESTNKKYECKVPWVWAPNQGGFSSWWSPGSAAERQFGDSGNNVIVAREEQKIR